MWQKEKGKKKEKQELLSQAYLYQLYNFQAVLLAKFLKF